MWATRKISAWDNEVDFIDIKGILNSFIARNDIKAAALAMFPKQ